jgi:diguanylate cyclase (GGDEF)-like protein
VFFDYIGHHQFRLLSDIRSILGPLAWPLLVYVGGKLAPEASSQRHANRVFDLTDPDCIAGIIIYTGGLADDVAEGDKRAFFTKRGATPLVSIAEPVPGVPSILVDNESGMQAMLRYLIRQRGFAQFAFLSGIEGNEDARIREKVFREELAAHGIPLNPALVARGDFHGKPAADAVKRWLDEGFSFEVIVAANDDMAQGAMLALNEKGLNVPFDVAVVGFDDSPVSRLVTPALTTVRQPVFEQGQEAARTLLSLIAGDEGAVTRILVTELVVRASCGMPPALEEEPQAASSEDLYETSFVRLIKLRDCPRILPDDWAATLLRYFFEEITSLQEPGISRGFLSLIQQWVRETSDGEYAVLWWNEVIATLHLNIVAHLSDPQQRAAAIRLCMRAQTLVTAAIVSTEREQLLRSRGKDRLLVDFSRDLVSQNTLQDVLQTAANHFLDFNIARAYVALFDDNPQAPHEFLRLVLAYEGGMVLPCTTDPYPATALLPDTLNDRIQNPLLIVHPVHTANAIYGLFLYEPKSDMRTDDQMQALDVLHHHLQHTLSTAIETTLQRNTLQEYAQGLEQIVESRTVQLNREVTERRRAEKALRKANDQLSQLAQIDGLTGLANRRSFDGYLAVQWHGHCRDEAPLTLILCDIDEFKRYNDFYGHLQGDICLRQVAKTLRHVVRRADDMVARYGGEEFVMLLPRTDLEGGARVAECVRQEIAKLALPHEASANKVVTISLGVATVTPGVDLPESLIEAADKALYHAKVSGRNRVGIAARQGLEPTSLAVS